MLALNFLVNDCANLRFFGIVYKILKGSGVLTVTMRWIPNLCTRAWIHKLTK